jgi:hypothetical protein
MFKKLISTFNKNDLNPTFDSNEKTIILFLFHLVNIKYQLFFHQLSFGEVAGLSPFVKLFYLKFTKFISRLNNSFELMLIF